MKLRIAEDLTLPIEAVTEKLAEQRGYATKWRAKNREKLRDYFRRYRSEHPELKQYHAQYFQDKLKPTQPHKSEAHKAATRAWRAKNRKHLTETSRLWRQKNRDHYNAMQRKRNVRRRDKKNAADREYRKNNPEIYRAGIAKAKAKKPDLYRTIAAQSALKRRARLRGAPVERVSIKRIIERDHSLCHLCNCAVLRPERSIDHLIPVLRGGAHAEWNLALAHISCNKSRGTKQILPEETRQAAETYIVSLHNRGAF